MPVQFADHISDKELMISTFLNPKYKERFFQNTPLSEMQEYLLDAYEKIQEQLVPVDINEVHDVNNDVASDDEDDFVGFRLHDGSNFNTCFRHFVNTTETTQVNVGPATSRDRLKVSINTEVTSYCHVPMLDNDKDSTFQPVMNWWQQNAGAYPMLSVVARKYLSCPPTSVESERLFSIGGGIYTPERSRLTPQHGEKLMFLQYNLPLFDYNY